jgi:uncharacterized membrane protein YgcG
MLRVLAAVFFLVAGLGGEASAEEVIRRFVSDVTVNTDGSLDVRETIVVTVEGQQIRRGILRDFPTTYKDRNGSTVRVDFDVRSVARDGRQEDYSTSNVNNGVRIQIGNKDVFLDHGEHTYEISYRTDRQLGFFESFDELYWNATGNGWTFPIEKAEAIVRLPPGAVIQQHAAYTGSFGDTGRDVRVIAAGGNQFSAETTRILDEGEGLTVAVAWQKGVVAAPTAAEQRMWWLRDNLGFFLAAFTLLAALVYYVYAWSRVGRDPPRGPIIPLFHPPEGLGPAGVRYVWKQGFDDKSLAAALVGLAVKKRVTIEDDDGDFAITRQADVGPALTQSEAALLRSLPRSRLTLKQSNHTSVRAARGALQSALDDEYDGSMFLRNIRWFVKGAAISIIGMLVSGFFTPTGEGAVVWFTTIFSSIWWGVILTVGYGVVKGLFGSGGFFAKVKNLMGMIFLVPFVAGGVAVPLVTLFGSDASPTMVIFFGIAVLLALINLVFYWLLKAPTPQGRQILDRIEGLRLYMTTAEEERLKVLHPPEKTPELFERYLPYAMALDCENEWNAKFAAVLAAAAAAGVVASSPSWYHGNSWNSDGFSRDLGNSLTSSISSSATPPGSSSGSSGGGFSGGGGGGGGGSGW